MATVLHLHPADNVVVATADLAAGTDVPLAGHVLTVTSPVRLGHKVAIGHVAVHDPIRKYGEIIGYATRPIKPGDWVHTHNLELGEYRPPTVAAAGAPPAGGATEIRMFQGYLRALGKAGTRNYLAVISNVNCSATVSHLIANHFGSDQLRAFPNVDGVVAFTHHGGCGMQHGSLGHEMLNRVLSGIARHPNIGGYLLVGLGCEQGDMDTLVRQGGLVQLEASRGAHSAVPSPPVLSIQDSGGTTRTVEAGIRTVAQLLPHVNAVSRVPIPASELVLATECGGSDGNSGITANPAVGWAADRIVACGGTVVLSETPEIFGAEHLLTRRAVSPAVARKLLERIEWWKWYTGLFGVSPGGNPSVGNKEGGLTTIAEKSLGAVAKAGSSPLVDVYQYAEPIAAKGMVFMDSPGYDPPSVTGMVAGGANMVVFTTGRGSCFGCKPVPTLKVASNTPMYERLESDMDLDAGCILAGTPVAQVGDLIFERILAVASGEKTRSEGHGMGDHEFVPWIVGPTL